MNFIVVVVISNWFNSSLPGNLLKKKEQNSLGNQSKFTKNVYNLNYKFKTKFSGILNQLKCIINNFMFNSSNIQFICMQQLK